MVRRRPKKRTNPEIPNQQRYKSGYKPKERLDAATIASNLQLQEQQRELAYSTIGLLMKMGLLSLAGLSLVNLGLSSVDRAGRNSELAAELKIESVKLFDLQKRFDRLFTIGGDRRLMDEQDQWIAPNRVRVIWR